MIRNRGFHSTGSKRSAPRQCRVFRENTGASGEDDFPENRLRHDLALPVRGRATFACGMESAVSHLFFHFSVHDALASPADMYFPFAVTLPDQQALDDGHGDVELLEDFRLFLYFARLDELVQPLFGKHQRHQVLLHGVLVGDIMHVLQLFGVETDETEVELLHLRDVPLQGFKYHVVAGGYVHRTAQALLRAYQYAVDGGIELRHDALPFLERHVALDHKYGTVRKTFAETALVKVECGYGRAALCRVSSVPAFRCTLSCSESRLRNSPLSGVGRSRP